MRSLHILLFSALFVDVDAFRGGFCVPFLDSDLCITAAAVSPVVRGAVLAGGALVIGKAVSKDIMIKIKEHDRSEVLGFRSAKERSKPDEKSTAARRFKRIVDKSAWRDSVLESAIALE